MRRLFLLIICFSFFSAAYSQGLRERVDSVSQEFREKVDSLTTNLRERAHERSQKFKGRLDSIIDIRDSRSKYDTAYISRPTQNWSFRVRLNLSGWGLDWLSEKENADFSFSAKPKTTVSLGASYRGISIGLSANITKLFKKSKDVEYSLASYGNKFGFEGFYHRSSTFKANLRFGENEVDMSSVIDRINMLNLSGYYAFNNRKFSFPAAFSQSYIQKRSAGSWLLGVNVFFSDARLNDPREVYSHLKLHLLTFGFGGGYGYNWVVKKWLLHVSVVPTFVFAHHNYFDISEDRTNMEYTFPEITSNGRLAVVRSFGNLFAGLSSVINVNLLGKRSDMQITNTKWKCRAFVGIRL